MVADLFHIGHINILKQARSYGDYLIVGIHNDEDVKSYKRTPIISGSDRSEIVRNCKLVDEVIDNAPLTISAKYIKDNNIFMLYEF